MIIFRFLLGLVVGWASVIVPAYLAEIATASTRGRLVAQNQLMITGGQLLAFTVNALLGSLFPHVGNIWRYMIAFGMIPSVMLFLGMWHALASNEGATHGSVEGVSPTPFKPAGKSSRN